jgi:hypothetical protein
MKANVVVYFLAKIPSGLWRINPSPYFIIVCMYTLLYIYCTPRDSKAYLAERAEMAYIGRNEKGEWGLALGSAAQGSLIDLMGVNFFPLYRVVGPRIFFLSLLLLVWGGLRLAVTVFLRVAIIV